MSASAFAGWLAFTLYFGAAVSDATVEQREAIQREVMPIVQQLRSRDPEVWKPALQNSVDILRQIMGARWQPAGQWREQIDILLREE